MTEENKSEGMSRENFLDAVKEFNPKADLKLISKAYDFSKNAHAGQKRVSGDDFFSHVLEVAYLLAELRLDSETVCAALLHDVVEDARIKPERIMAEFGGEVYELVRGVTKIKAIKLETGEEARNENLRKVLLATIKDIRVILIKLIDRLHNMRTLKYLDREKQIALSKETLNIYAPIAYKLGMYNIKSELEDLSLRYLEPDAYQEIKSKIAKKKEQRDAEVKHLTNEIEKKLREKGIKANVVGRAKSFYSIYKKIKKKGYHFENVHDLYAIRILADSDDECYRILGVIHSSWTPIPGTFTDYIATPKPNMYQSIHTDIIVGGEPVEIQIRTMDMHYQAEDGIAAHWRYKDTERDKEFDKKISWLKQLLEWKRDSADARDFIESMKIDLFKDQIVVFTPKGDPIPLPEGSTPIDFAYMVHTDIGNHCVRVKVNNAIAPLDSELKSGDLVEIIIAKNAKPSRHWLKFAKTHQAKGKIRHALDIDADREQKPEDETMGDEDLIQKLDIKGIKLNQVKLARCCRPQFKDEVQGFRMKYGKIAVHKLTCDNIRLQDEKKKIKLGWIDTGAKPSIIELRIEIIDRIGLLADILNIFSREGLNVETVTQRMIKEKLVILFELKMTKKINISELINQLKAIRNIIDVRRTG